MHQFLILQHGKYKYMNIFEFGLQGATGVSAFHLTARRPWLKSQLGPFCLEFVCSYHACMGFLCTLWLLPTVQRHGS